MIALCELTKLCTDNSFFTYDGKVYSQTSGLAMGSNISPFLAEIFMSNLEEELAENEIFPKCWWRFVDDVFSVIKKTHLRRFLSILNNFHPSIKFTYEEERENQIPFLDVMIIRNNENIVELDIYRKPTSTDRYITSDSMHAPQHKLAAFNSMIHRLVTLPLTTERYSKELDHIYGVARKNGYLRQTIDRLLRKKEMRAHNRRLTTLRSQRERNLSKSVIATYHPRVNQNLTSALRSSNFQLMNKAHNKLSDMLGNTKDKLDNMKKSGIYKINCDNCDHFYIGQTIRSIEVRFKEHLKKFEKRHYDGSAVALHMHFNNHTVSLNNLALLQNITDRRKLDFFETAHINASDPDKLLTGKAGPCNSLLLRYV